MYCTNCGKPIDNNNFCIHCGCNLNNMGKIVFENVYRKGKSGSGRYSYYKSVFCYVDKQYFNAISGYSLTNLIYNISYGKHTVQLVIGSIVLEKEVEITPENPIAYIHTTFSPVDFSVEYCQSIKPYKNNADGSKYKGKNLKSLRRLENIPLCKNILVSAFRTNFRIYHDFWLFIQ